MLCRFFNLMIVVYRKIKERLAHVAHISNGQYRILVSYLLRFRKKACFSNKSYLPVPYLFNISKIRRL